MKFGKYTDIRSRMVTEEEAQSRPKSKGLWVVEGLLVQSLGRQTWVEINSHHSEIEAEKAHVKILRKINKAK